MLGVGVQRQTQVVAVVQRLGVEVGRGAVLVQGHYLNVAGTLVVLLQAGLQLFGTDLPRQQA